MKTLEKRKRRRSRLSKEPHNQFHLRFQEKLAVFLVARPLELPFQYIHICELKSSYATQPITKAKDQIIGSWLKLHSLMSLLQSYHPEEWQVRGIIASFTPTPEQEAAILRMKENGNEAGNFCYNLQRDRKYPMPEANCKSYFCPLNVPGITIYHVPVPYQTEAFGVNFDTLIQ